MLEVTIASLLAGLFLYQTVLCRRLVKKQTHHVLETLGADEALQAPQEEVIPVPPKPIVLPEAANRINE